MPLQLFHFCCHILKLMCNADGDLPHTEAHVQCRRDAPCMDLTAGWQRGMCAGLLSHQVDGVDVCSLLHQVT